MMTPLSPPSVLGRVPQTAALLVVCLLCTPLALHQHFRPFHLLSVFCRSPRCPSSSPYAALGPDSSKSSLTSRLSTDRLLLSVDAATTEAPNPNEMTPKPEVVLCLNGETYFAVALWAARHVNSTWPATPAYPGNRTELGFRMDVPIRVKSIPFESLLKAERTVEWFAANGTDCDVFVGPALSPSAIALAGYVKESQIWIDPAATSSALSNKTLHPVFSRMVASWSQETKPAVRFLNALGISHIIVICDRRVGTSFAARFTETWRALNPDVPTDAVLSTECLNTRTANMTLWDRVITTIASSRIRTVFVATYVWTAEDFMQKLNATRPDLVKERVFVFADTAPCEPLPFPGVLCLSPSIPANSLPEFSNRSAASQAEDLAFYTSLGVSSEWLNVPNVITTIESFHGLIYDATVFGLTAMFKYRAAASAGTVPSVNGTELTPAEYARLVTVPNGLTGELSLTSAGDRRHIRTFIYNSDTENAVQEVGYVNSEVHFDTAHLYLAGRMGVVPSALLPIVPTAPASRISAAAIALMCIVTVSLVTITVGCGAYFFRVGKVCADPPPSAFTGAPGEEDADDSADLDNRAEWGVRGSPP